MDSKRQTELKTNEVKKNKQLFLAQYDEKTEPYELMALQDLSTMAVHYNKKFGIAIYVSGQTPFGKAKFKAFQEGIELIESGALPYAKYVKDLYSRVGFIKGTKFYEELHSFHRFKHSDSIFTSSWADMLEVFGRFFDRTGDLAGQYVIKKLTPEQMRQFDAACHAQSSFSDKLKKAVEDWNSIKYFHHFVDHPFGDVRVNDFPFEKYKTELAPFVKFYEKYAIALKHDLSLEEIKKFEAVCEKFSFKAELDALIQKLQKEKLNEEISLCVLSKEEAIEEVCSIQKELKQDEVAGYLCRLREGRKLHVEALVITRDSVINIIQYRDWCLMTSDTYLPQLRHIVGKSDIAGFISADRFPDVPLAGGVECGTLALLYLKELLKNQAEQLKTLTLSFSFYSEGKVCHFFLPSPQVLRYSQTSAYNTILAAMLSQKDTVSIEAKLRIHADELRETRKLTVTTIQKLLKDTLVEAKSKNNVTLAAKSQKLLEILPAFSKAWLEEYKNSQEKRARMQKDGRNSYLLYRTLKMEKICKMSLLPPPVQKMDQQEVEEYKVEVKTK